MRIPFFETLDRVTDSKFILKKSSAPKSYWTRRDKVVISSLNSNEWQKSIFWGKLRVFVVNIWGEGLKIAVCSFLVAFPLAKPFGHFAGEYSSSFFIGRFLVQYQKSWTL